MDFELSDDQAALRDAAAKLLAVQSSPERVRAALASDGGYDRDLWAAMAEQGWMAVERPAALGGLGLGSVETAVLCEQLGWCAAPVPFLPTLLAQRVLGDGEAEGSGFSAEWAAALADGSAVGCVAWSPERAPVRATRDGGRWVLHGSPGPVVGAPEADVAVVVAAEAPAGGSPAAGPLVVLAVPLDEPLRPSVEPAMDRTRSLGRLTFDGTRAERIGGAAAAEALLDRGATAVSALLLGGSARVLEMTVEYAKARVQFGRPIGSFQAVKHRCADMLVDVEGMRSTVYYAAWCVGQAGSGSFGAADRTEPSVAADASVAASAAKAWCSEAGRRVMASGLQVHGGIGFTWEHDLHVYLKRSQLDQWSFGGAGYHLDRLARYLRSRVAASLPVL